jgi:protocatechuate 3,4-dioxygenase beta subunit
VRLVRVVVCSLALALAVGYLASAQQQEDPPTTGSIAGSVADPAGAPIAGAAITISGVSGDASAATDDRGQYLAAGLEPGLYDVTISAPSFKSIQERNVAVSAGGSARLDARLEPEDDSGSPQQGAVDILAGAGSSDPLAQ